MKAAVRRTHRCGVTCRCPDHDTPLYYWPAGDLHACQNPNCCYAHGISAEALAAADQGLPMTSYAPDVFSRFRAARRADPDRIPPRAVPVAEVLRSAFLYNDPVPTVVRDPELRRLLDSLPDDPTPAAYDEDQALGRLAMAAETLHMALDVREAEATDNLAGHDGELHHVARRVLESIAIVLTQHEPTIARPATETQPEGS
ncbi:hypothetical protein PV516_18505 [Streptomyces scabiei]|uniref:hypothetical protein n=1 Tax=Streptomyces scabiei TaxID=1930 RepID=UPI0029BDA6F5|nr:hypothetical protein [Streptomyces scabiei]MDX3165777.1 hypothetical protein [Streptomyces scabiei]